MTIFFVILIPFFLISFTLNLIAYQSFKDFNYKKAVKRNYKLIFPVHLVIFSIISTAFGFYFIWYLEYGGLYLVAILAFIIIVPITFIPFAYSSVIFINKEKLKEISSKIRKCYFCKSELSDSYNYCPYCGREQKRVI
jgi:hypothetical protein